LEIERVSRYSGRIFYRPQSFALLENSLWVCVRLSRFRSILPH
jgi:hypothetical protein